MIEFIEQYKIAYALFEKYGFPTPRVYRNPRSNDPDKVLFLVIDNSPHDEVRESLRQLHLEDALEKFMKCPFLILTPQFVGDFTKVKLNNSTLKCITLTPDLSSEILKEKLIEIFGEPWVVLGKTSETTPPPPKANGVRLR